MLIERRDEGTASRHDAGCGKERGNDAPRRASDGRKGGQHGQRATQQIQDALSNAPGAGLHAQHVLCEQCHADTAPGEKDDGDRQAAVCYTIQSHRVSEVCSSKGFLLCFGDNSFLRLQEARLSFLA